MFYDRQESDEEEDILHQPQLPNQIQHQVLPQPPLQFEQFENPERAAKVYAMPVSLIGDFENEQLSCHGIVKRSGPLESGPCKNC